MTVDMWSRLRGENDVESTVSQGLDINLEDCMVTMENIFNGVHVVNLRRYVSRSGDAKEYAKKFIQAGGEASLNQANAYMQGKGFSPVKDEKELHELAMRMKNPEKWMEKDSKFDAGDVQSAKTVHNTTAIAGGALTVLGILTGSDAMTAVGVGTQVGGAISSSSAAENAKESRLIRIQNNLVFVYCYANEKGYRDFDSIRAIYYSQAKNKIKLIKVAA